MNVRLVLLGGFHQFNHFGKHRVPAGCRCGDGQVAMRDDAAADDRVVFEFADGQTLAGEHGLVHVGATGKHRPVHGDFVAFVDLELVAGHDFFDFDGDDRAGGHDFTGGFDLQAGEFADGRGGLFHRSFFQKVAEQDEGDDTGASLEKDVIVVALRRTDDAVNERRRASHENQHVHVRRPVAQSAEAGAAEMEKSDGIHRQAEGELHPMIFQKMQPRHAEKVRQQKRSGEDGGDNQLLV